MVRFCRKKSGGSVCSSVGPLYVLCYFLVFLERCIILHQQGYEWAAMLEYIPLNISELFMIQNLFGIVSINALSWYMSVWFVAGTVLSFGCWIVRKRLPRAELYFCFFIPIFWYAYCQKRELFFNTTESYMGIMYGICGMCLGLGAYRMLLYQLEVIPLRIFSRIYVPMTILFSLIVVVILEFCKYIIRVVQKCL